MKQCGGACVAVIERRGRGRIVFFSLMPKVERTTSPKPKEEFTGMMGNLARALDERHKVMHSSGEYNHS